MQPPFGLASLFDECSFLFFFFYSFFFFFWYKISSLSPPPPLPSPFPVLNLSKMDEKFRKYDQTLIHDLNLLNSIMQASPYQTAPKMIKKHGQNEQKFTYALSRLSLSWISGNLNMLKNFLKTTPTPNFMQIPQMVHPLILGHRQTDRQTDRWKDMVSN